MGFQDEKVMQDIELESLSARFDHSQKVKTTLSEASHFYREWLRFF